MKDTMTAKAIVGDTFTYTLNLIQGNTVVQFLTSVFTVFIANIMESHDLLIKGIIGLYIIDFILGILKAIKKGNTSSSGLWSGANKLMIYCIYLYVAVVVDTSIGFSVFVPIVFSLIILRDAISILENLDEIGVPDHTGLLSLMKKILKYNQERILNKDYTDMKKKKPK